MSSSSSENKRRFKNDSALWKYLAVKVPRIVSSDQNEYEISQLLQALKEDICGEKQYDETNPVIVVCNERLERALGVKALHLAELREYLDKHLQPCDETMTDDRASIDKPEPSTALTRARTVPPGPSSSCFSLLKRTQSTGGQTTRADDIFAVKPAFQEVLKAVDGFDDSVKTFRYGQLTQLLSVYILKNRERFFDERNINVAIVTDDPLGKALGVNTFHRSQVTALLRKQLVPLTDLIKENNTLDKGMKRDHSEDEEEGSDTERQSQRKRNISDDDDDTESPYSSDKDDRENSDSQRSRRKRSRKISSFSVSILGYDSFDEETIYSAQEYETAGANSRSEVSDSESEEGRRRGNRRGSKSDRSRDVSTDEIERVYRIEYEIEEEEEEEGEDAKRKKKYSMDSSSGDESILEDVLATMVMLDSGDEFWADSESDFDSDVESDLSRRETNGPKCCRCGQKNETTLPYCDICWQERREAYPKREHPRKKRTKKNKRTKGQCTKNGKKKETSSKSTSDVEVGAKASTSYSPPPFARSQSHPGGGSNKNEEEEEKGYGSQFRDSQDSGLGKDEAVYTADTACSSSSSGHDEDDEIIAACDSAASSSKQNNCSICYRRPKNATLIHGRIGHTVCCYPCAKRLWKSQRPCPICRRKIEKFVFNVEA